MTDAEIRAINEPLWKFEGWERHLGSDDDMWFRAEDQEGYLDLTPWYVLMETHDYTESMDNLCRAMGKLTTEQRKRVESSIFCGTYPGLWTESKGHYGRWLLFDLSTADLAKIVSKEVSND